jgi:hypothetical protein
LLYRSEEEHYEKAIELLDKRKIEARRWGAVLKAALGSEELEYMNNAPR